MDYIQVTKDNIENEHICCAISNNKDIQVSSKKNWLSTGFDDGLVFLKSTQRRTLYIDEFTNNSSTRFSNKMKKDLTVKIPENFKANVFSLDIVSADVNIEGLNTIDFELNSVSGNPVISFASQPHEIETDTVSGNIQLVLPADISGYSISNESVSGSINTNDFGNTLYYGDGYTRIEHDAVSGNLTLEKAE